MSNVWVASTRRFASKEEMGKKIMLSLEEELGYERIVTKLEEVWGGGGVFEKGRKLLQKKKLDWFARREQSVPVYGLLCFISI